MKATKLHLGPLFVILYILFAVYLIGTQGFFGESFIVVFLGLPWSYLALFFDKFFPKEGTAWFHFFLYVEFLGPIILNAVLFYLLGVGIDKVRFGNRSLWWWSVIIILSLLLISTIIWYIIICRNLSC